MLRLLISFLVLWLSFADCGVSAESVAVFPKTLDANCRNGDAELYDECGDQFEILKSATEEAKKTGKVLVVSYGAEWCIWCHVLDAHLKGQYGEFKYEVEDYPSSMAESLGPHDREQAADLNTFAAQNMILVHIEGRYAPNGMDVLRSLGADRDFEGSIPYLFSVKDGRVASRLTFKKNDPMEKRRDGLFLYRGYNRDKLLDQIRLLVEAAR